MKESAVCDRCHLEEDSIEHKFWHCRFAQTFWNVIRDWLVANNILDRESDFSDKTVLLGLGTSPIVNHITIVAKMIIILRERLSLSELNKVAPGRS